MAPWKPAAMKDMLLYNSMKDMLLKPAAMKDMLLYNNAVV